MNTLVRYRQLFERAAFDLKLARDAGAHVPCARLARIERARRELRAELRSLETNREQTTATFTTRDRAALTD